MSELVSLLIDGETVSVPSGATVAVAVAMRASACRLSVTGQPRGPLCGMGTCFECRVTLDGRPHVRSCQIIATPGMIVRTET